MYIIPDSKSKRSTSFGFGKKSDFTSSSSRDNPPPGTYNETDRMYKFKKTGLKFGPGREVVIL